MANRAAKYALYDCLCRVGKALGSGRRVEIIEVLAQGERSVEDLAREIGQSTANTSQHLQHLLRAGLVAQRRARTRVYYSLTDDDVALLWSTMRTVAARHVGNFAALSAAYLGDRSTVPIITRDALCQLLITGEAIALDVRPHVEFLASHITGAISMPIDAMERRITELPTRATITAYCRGPFSVYADEAVRLLHAKGFRATRLEDGFPEWSRAGLPVAVGEG